MRLIISNWVSSVSTCHRFPDELVPDVVKLRKLWNETIEMFEEATNPLQKRVGAGGFGKKVTNQGFGRI